MYPTTRVASTLFAAAAFAALAVTGIPTASADPQCQPGGPPHSAATIAVDKVYGQPATLWITDDSVVGLSTADGTTSQRVMTASPLVQRAAMFDAQQDGTHQVIVDTGRQGYLYAAVGCVLTPVVDRSGVPFQFDVGHRLGNGDGYGCGDLGNGPRLIGFLKLEDQPGMMRRTEIPLDGATATIGASDVVPTWTDVSCSGRTMERNGVSAPIP
jgi:hypothetical protein